MATESLEYSGIRPPSFPRLRPVNNITPFTYQDGSTYLEILSALENYIKTILVPDVDGTLKEFTSELNKLISELESGLEVDRNLIQSMYDNFTEIITEKVDFINNKTGATDIQQIKLSANRQITVDPLWPTNQPVEFVLTQDATGGRTISYASNITGSVEVNPAPGSVTRFILIPDGTGKWFTVQSTRTLTELDTRISDVVAPKISKVAADFAEGDARLTQAMNSGFASAAERSADNLSKINAANVRIDQTNEVAEDNGYVFANFVANGAAGEHLNLFYSPDGKTLFGGENNPVYVPADGNGLRDPSIIYRNNRWYVAYTTKDGQNKDFAIATSVTGHAGSWTLLTKVSVAAVPGIVKAWAPEFIIDGNDVYVFFSRINSANTGAMQYVKATNTALTAWSAPSPVTWLSEPSSYIDGVPVKGTDGKWYMFYSIGQSIDRAVSTKITGPWTTDRSGNWAGWGSTIEGPTVVKDGNIFRMYFDRYGNNDGLHWSESTSLDGPWSSPVKVVTAPYVLKNGETIRHGSVHKLRGSQERNKINAAIAMPQTMGNHSEWQNAPGIPVSNQTRTVMRWVVPDENEMVNPGLISFEDGGTFTFNEYGVYSITLTAGAKGVTGVDRSFIEMTDVTGNTIHMRQSSGGEDTMSFSIANFKPRAAGEKFRFYIYIRWTGAGSSAAVPIRVRITKVANA